MDHITSWQNSIAFDRESAAIQAMYSAINKIVELCQGYSEFFIDKSLQFLKGKCV